MPVEDNSYPIRREPNSEPQAEAPLPVARNETPPAASTENAPEKNEPIAVKLEEDIKSGERWLIGIGIATLIINTFIGIIYYAQLREMRKATTATQDAVKVAQDTLTETQHSNYQARLDSQADSAASDKRAHDSLQATIDNFRGEQRPWLGVTGYKIQQDLTIPGNVSNDSAVIGFYNSGKTPAREVHALVGLSFKSPDHVLNGDDVRWMDRFIMDIRMRRAKPDPIGFGKGNLGTSYRIYPKDLQFFPVILESISLGSIAPNVTSIYRHPETWKAGQGRQEFLFGTLSYIDNQRLGHETKFCVYRPSGADERLTVCPIFNDMN